jgi:hypothetical protein
MNDHVDKKQLLLAMKEETIAQLHAVHAENVDEFLHRVEKCERITKLIDQLDSTGNKSEPTEEKEIKHIIKDILELREQITPLLEPLREKLRQRSVIERKQTIIHQGYGEEDAYHPSIFFDKKN